MAKSTKKTYARSAREGSYRIFDDVMDVAVALLRSRKELGVVKLQSLAAATKDYATSMTDLPTLQQQALAASQGMENFAEYVLHTDVHHMLDDATVLARRRPLLTLGVAAAAGLAATRMLIGTRTQPIAKPVKRAARKASKVKIAAARRGSNGTAHANA